MVHAKGSYSAARSCFCALLLHQICERFDLLLDRIHGVVRLGLRQIEIRWLLGEQDHVRDDLGQNLLDRDGITDDIHLFNANLREWEDYYNYHRLHGALAGQTPYERLLAKARAGASPGVLRLTNCAVARRPPSDLQKESRGCDVLINCEAAR